MIKLPGKTAYSGVRRTTTRKSGFKSHPDSTGGEFKTEQGVGFDISPENPLTISFTFPDIQVGKFTGFGGFFRCDEPIEVKIINPNTKKNLCTEYQVTSVSKFGSIWWSEEGNSSVIVQFSSCVNTKVFLYNVDCGTIWHEAFDQTIENGQKASHLKNLHNIMPETGFYIEQGDISFNLPENDHSQTFELKSCNRCARFLPINTLHERDTLSFSNHCVARAPCTHKGFGILTDIDRNKVVDLHYGFQLECRFCKKFFVNRTLNPQRTAAQMKEDGQRRRNFELLIAEIYQSSPQLAYRTKTGRELVDDIWEKFDRKCFCCNEPLASSRKMHLDHTRPLALLWPLDETATALCPSCNTSKRDKNPSEFYTPDQIKKLSVITGLSVDELMTPEPNHEVIQILIERVDWLYEVFLTKPELLKERDGKVTAELVVKALDKVLSRSNNKSYNFSFIEEYNKRRDDHIQFDDSDDLNSVI